MKAHARDVPLAADLEMHFVTGGYVGLCRLGAGEVNVCGLFATRGPVPQLAEDWQERLRGPADSVLHERLHAARFLAESFRAVAGLDLRPASATDTAECGVGEAVTMIPPVTGNGMSMAFESARWAVDPLVAYSRGELAWDEARLAVARQCDTGFARRLRWARWLQRMLMQPGSREVLLWAGRADWLWRVVFTRTR